MGARNLVIVESPAKAKTIAGYLGPDFAVEASVGHIRDIPQPKELPADQKKGPFGRFGVNVDDGSFEALYVIDADKKKKVSELKRLLKDAETLYLATDEDREGEAIAWHLLQVLKPKVPVYRLTFPEITKEAIERGFGQLRDIDQDLGDAQETRRILDRLYGYEVSPVLWRKVAAGLSAGRVQSVATRLVVQRERERIAFVPADYWDLTGQFSRPEGQDAGRAFSARLSSEIWVKIPLRVSPPTTVTSFKVEPPCTWRRSTWLSGFMSASTTALALSSRRRRTVETTSRVTTTTAMTTWAIRVALYG